MVSVLTDVILKLLKDTHDVTVILGINDVEGLVAVDYLNSVFFAQFNDLTVYFVILLLGMNIYAYRFPRMIF